MLPISNCLLNYIPMKRPLTYLLLFFATATTLSQTNADMEALLSMCLNQTEMVVAHHTNAQGATVVPIVTDANIPNTLAVSYFETPIVFLSEQEINAMQLSYLKFESFAITSPTEAHATFVYYCSGDCNNSKYVLAFKKYTDTWSISSNKTSVLE